MALVLKKKAFNLTNLPSREIAEWFLKANPSGQFPLLLRKKEFVRGPIEILRYIDVEVPRKPYLFQTIDVEDLAIEIHEEISSRFNSYLKSSDRIEQANAKTALEEQVLELNDKLVGPFLTGKHVTGADIVYYCWAERFAVLKEYKDWDFFAVSARYLQCHGADNGNNRRMYSIPHHWPRPGIGLIVAGLHSMMLTLSIIPAI